MEIAVAQHRNMNNISKNSTHHFASRNASRVGFRMVSSPVCVIIDIAYQITEVQKGVRQKGVMSSHLH